MTKDEALKLALDALINHEGNYELEKAGAARSHKAITAIKQALAAQPAPVQDSDHEFKNFHRVLCERFGYTHDEVDWKRDQVSLIEWIAKQVKPAAPVQEPVVLTDDEIWKFWWNKPEAPEGEDASMEAQFVSACREAIKAAAQPATPLTDWVSVDDRLPESGGYYLVTVDTDEGPHVDVLMYNAKRKHWEHEGEPTFCHSYLFSPTHWAARPEAAHGIKEKS